MQQGFIIIKSDRSLWYIDTEKLYGFPSKSIVNIKLAGKEYFSHKIAENVDSFKVDLHMLGRSKR